LKMTQKVRRRGGRDAQTLMKWCGISVGLYPPQNSIAGQLRLILRHLRVNEVVDVGAHHGEFARFLRRDVGYKGPILSFEPHPVSFSIVEQRMKGDAHWRGRQIALGDTEGTLELGVFADTAFNSAYVPSGFGLEAFGRYMQSTGELEVPVKRLDSIPMGRPVVLKTDTQGHDMKVLEGASGIMIDVVAVLIELSVMPIYEQTPSWLEVCRRLDEWGFRPVTLSPISHEHGTLNVVEFDGLFLRTY
jgi:FkbM family methyltransferase